MRFLLISGAGDGLGLALRLRMDGHEVATWIRESRSKDNYAGLLHRIPNGWEKWLTPETVVIFDSTGGGRTAERLKARGVPVFAGSQFADELELDRDVAYEIMREVGIKTPHSETFTSWDEGKAYVRKSGKRLAFKPSGALGGDVGSYVAYDTEDMLEMLDVMAERTKQKPEFELQDFVKGVCISSEGWFNGVEFMTPFNHTLERKQLMNQDLGPSGGCAGNIVWQCGLGTLCTAQGIQRMERILAHHEYVGPIDLNAVVNDEGVWGLEFTPRFGYDAMPAFLELVEGDLGAVIASMARREHPKSFAVRHGFAGAVRVSVTPYPNEKFPADEGMPVRGLTREDRAHTYMYDLALNDKNRLVTTKAHGLVAVFTGHGDTIPGAMKGPYEMAERLRVGGKQYRTDLTGLFMDEFDQVGPWTKEGVVDGSVSRQALHPADPVRIVPD